MAEAPLVVLAQDFVFRQQLEAPEQQLGEIDCALALALLVVGGVDLGVAAAEFIVGLGLARALALFLVGVDVMLHLLRRKAVFVHVHRLQHALHQRQLVGRVEDLKQLRQSRVAEVRAQQAVAQPVESAHPHAAGGDRQHGGDAREHFLRRLVGERDREHAGGADVAGLDQPGDARGEHARLARARARQDQRGLVGQGDGGELFGVEIGEKGHRAARVFLQPRFYRSGRPRQPRISRMRPISCAAAAALVWIEGQPCIMPVCH